MCKSGVSVAEDVWKNLLPLSTRHFDIFWRPVKVTVQGFKFESSAVARFLTETSLVHPWSHLCRKSDSTHWTEIDVKRDVSSAKEATHFDIAAQKDQQKIVKRCSESLLIACKLSMLNSKIPKCCTSSSTSTLAFLQKYLWFWYQFPYTAKMLY